jgi:hypothetical protein
MIIQVDKVKTNEKDLMTLLSSPEAQKDLVERVLSARRKREEEDPGEGENGIFQPWEVQEVDVEPFCGGTLLFAWTGYLDKGSEKDSRVLFPTLASKN